MKIIKNLFLFLILIGVIALSFWISFTLGKNLLVPAKKIPTADILTMDKNVLDEIGKITIEVDAISKKALEIEPGYMTPKISEKISRSVSKTITRPAYIVQSGLFSLKSNAKALVQQLKEKGFSAKFEVSGKYYKVFTPASALSEANQIAKSIRDAGFEAIVSLPAGRRGGSK